MSTSKQQQKPKICDIYEVGDFIDAKDNQGDWRVGYIVDKNDMAKSFKIRFDGWSSKYDEIYRFNNPKLKQFRSIVVGYTGQKKNPAMRQGWKFSIQDLQTKMLDLHSYIAKNSKKHTSSAHSFNQWIRGHNYLYVDFLMTCKFSNPEEIHKVIDFLWKVIQFFKLNITLSIKYLKDVIENFDKFTQNIQKTYFEHLQDVQVAKTWAFYEIFDMIYTISGSYERLSQFFKDNEDLLRNQFEIPTNKQVFLDYKYKIVEYFFRNKGFELVNELLKNLQNLNKPIPYTFLYSLAHLISGLSSHLQSKLKQSFALQFQQITNKSLEFLGDKQMKDFNQFQIVDLINQILSFRLEKQIINWSQLVQIQVYFKMISCPFFEKKLRGITSLQQFIQKNVSTKKQEQELDIIADGTLLKWIESKKLFDVLFSNDNPQIIKKSTELIKYLYHRDNEMQRYIELVWKYRQGKHQTALKEIYNFMGEIPNYDKNQQFTRILFLKHLSKLQESLWDPEYLKMIKDYTLSALTNCVSGQLKSTYGYQMIYNFSLKNQADETMINYLIQILDKLKQYKIIEKFVTEYFISIQKNIHPQFHVNLLVKILREKMIDVRSLKLDSQQIILNRIIQTKNSLTQNIQQQFQLLNQYLKQAKQLIPETNFINFWNQIIDSKARTYFFKWLFKVRDTGKILITNFIHSQTKQFLLQNFWTDQYLLKHKIDEFQATFLLQLFKFINDKEEKIKRSNIVFQVLDQNLLGIQKIFSVYLSSKDFKTSEILAKGLAEIYYSGSNSLAQFNVDLLGDFIQKVIFMMKDFSETSNLQGVKKMLRLVEQLILRDEEIFDVQQISRMQSFSNISVKNIEKNQEKIIRFNLLQSIYTIKKIIAQKFNLQLNKFDIIVNEQQPITYQSYFKSLAQIDMKGKILIKYRNEQTSKTKNYLNQFLELFFQLLGNKAIQQRVWNIVSKLPISNQIRQKILHSQNPLEILANKDSFYKQLYMFKVALSIQKKWWNLTLQNMTKFFITRLQKTKGQTQIQRQYIMVSGKLLQYIIKKEKIKNQKILTQSFLSVFEIVKRIILQLNQFTQINNLFNIKKFIQAFFLIGEQLNTYLAQNQLISKFPDALSLLLNDPEIEGFLKLCLLQHKLQLIRKQFPTKLITLIKDQKDKYAVKLAGIILDDLLDATVKIQSKNLGQYIIFSHYILQRLDPFLKQFYAKKKCFYFKKIYKFIENQQPQKNIQAKNLKLQCYLTIIKFVIKEVSPDELQKFFIFLYSECLFKGNQSKCKSKQTRNYVFNIFVRLVKYNKTSQLIFSTFSHLHRNGLWRTRRLDDWTIAQSQRLKSSTNYVGLRNLGCICYMNSFFQQIFMIQEFRKSLLLSEDTEYNPKTLQDNVLFQVKKMFMNLIYSDKKAYNPKSFCLSFKDYEGNPTNVNQQMDIDEFSGILFDRIENQLKGTKSSALIKDTFGGVYSNQIICKGCPHFSETEQSFLSLGLTVKDKHSIYESLETMIKGDTLDGDNAYYCERCDKKVSAVKRVCLKKLPNYLIVALKRFQFDYNTMTKQKVNDYCEFPHNLNLQEYSYQYLRKSQNLKSAQEDQQIKDKKYYEYKLKGVVIHIGYADSGHYYSLIQERSGEQRWIQFNDTIVRNFNIQNLNDEAFGGQTGGIQSKQKIKNAYLLVYERVQKINSLQGQLERQGESFQKIQMYSEVLQNIQKQNYQYNIENILFSEQYAKFIKSLIDQAQKNKYDLELQKFIISAIFTVIIRTKTFIDLFDTLRKVYTSCCKGNKVLCEFILSQFCNLRVYEQFFRSCPLKEIKRNIAVWLGLLIRQVDDKTRQKFMKAMLFKITKENENNFEALTIIHNLIEEEKCFRFMLENNLIGRLLENIIRREPRYFGSTETLEPSIQNQQNYLGFQQIIQKTPFELKKIKYDNESGYVWAILNNIIKKFPLKQLPSILHPKQVQYLYLNRDKIYKILQELKSKFDIDLFTSLLAHLSQQNMEFTIMLLQLIQKGLKEFQSKRYRQFFVLFHKLINIQDNFIQERITGIFNLVRSLKENQKYAMDCTIIELWLCKIINQNQTLRNYLIREKTILKYLASLPLSKVPSDDLSKKNANYIDTSVSKLHGIPFPPSRRGYIKVLRQVQNFYQKLLNNQYEAINSFQGGNHIVYDKIAPGERIAYFNVKDKVAYEEALVKEVFSDKILISPKISPNKSFWIWNDDQRLTSNLRVLKIDSSNELDSSKTTQMQEQIDFEAVN